MRTLTTTLARVTQILRGNPLFARMSAVSLESLARESRLVWQDAGEMIFLQSDPADAAYIIQSGTVAICLSNVDGRQLVIRELHAGECFGELALVTGQARSASVMAGEDCHVLVIPRRAFLAVLDNEPDLSRRLLEATALRLSSSSEFESGLAFLDAQARVARLLLDLCNQAQSGPILISQEELADRTGLIRQTVAKTLGQWRRSGWIKTGRGRIELVDASALENWLGERVGL